MNQRLKNHTLSVRYTKEPFSQVAQAIQIEGELNPLLVIHYGNAKPDPQIYPQISLSMLPLNDSTSEIWLTSDKVTYGKESMINYGFTEHLLFATLTIPQNSNTDFSEQINSAYKKICHFIREQEYAHLLRVWNYFAGINDNENDLERYQHFCVGRHQALDGTALIDKLSLPAASALGTDFGETYIIFIAAKEPGHAIENPRQIAAYQYPKQYSPLSPTFSRAFYKKWPNENHVYISGTASIVGHNSLHVGNAVEQTKESLENVNVLLKHIAKEKNISQNILLNNENISLKVYIRNHNDYDAIKSIIESVYGEHVKAIYLQADICRQELLVEIEAFIRLST